MRLISFISLLALTACMSANNDAMYEQVDWMRSNEFKACRASFEEEQKEYKKAKKEYDLKVKNYDYNGLKKKFDREMAEFEAGTRAIMPLAPSVLGDAGVGPRLPNAGKCTNPPDGWEPK